MYLDAGSLAQQSPYPGYSFLLARRGLSLREICSGILGVISFDFVLSASLSSASWVIVEMLENALASRGAH